MYGFDYQETGLTTRNLLPDRQDKFVHLLLSLVATHHWPLYQLHIKNDFLVDEAYMKLGCCSKRTFKLYF